MHISRVRIVNFANFEELDIATGENLVIVGENKVGKSNFLKAIRLILDPGLSERDRRLSLEHFWDGLGDDKLGATVEVSIELTDFDGDARLLAHLADCIVEVGPPMVARLTYRYRPDPALARAAQSLADYDYVIFGGDDPDNDIQGSVRRMLPLDVQGALRDAEKDLASWRHSPLRPLIEELTQTLGEAERGEIQTEIDEAQSALAERPEIRETATKIGDRLTAMVGEQHAVPLTLGLAPTRLDALLRGLRLLIDDGQRSISDASLGSANLIFLALKSLEIDRLASDGERDHTFFAVEEPEAHLHPHVQRLVYRYFLEKPKDASDVARRLTTILSTHSPHIASVAPLKSIVLLRYDAAAGASTGVTAAKVPLLPSELEDLERYIDVTRGELFFARGVILVEGEAERFLVPAYAEALGMPLDALGVSVCSVAGTNFKPYAKLLGRNGLKIPFVILTDRDLIDDTDYGLNRLRQLLKIRFPGIDVDAHSDAELLTKGQKIGVFLNEGTLETELFLTGLEEEMQEVLLAQLPGLKSKTKDTLQGWVDAPSTVDTEALIKLIERIGKGRFAQLLAGKVTAANCPPYIQAALEYIRDALN